jgi:hypothetical protein
VGGGRGQKLEGPVHFSRYVKNILRQYEQFCKMDIDFINSESTKT